jgi:hypothetical protein
MKLMTVRDFVRGGYRTVTEEVVIMRNLEPVGIWKPIMPGQRVSFLNGSEKRVRIKKSP